MLSMVFPLIARAKPSRVGCRADYCLYMSFVNRNGDVYLFILSLALINSLFDIDAHSVSGNVARRVLSSVRGLGMKDPVTELQKSHERKSIAEAETTEMKDKKNK